jgi:hypothetical protein
MARKGSAGAIAAVLIVVGVAVYLVSCGEKEPPPVMEVLEPSDPAVEEFEKRRQEYEGQLGSMPVSGLAEEIAKDSREGVESFNSPAAREVRRRAKELSDDGASVEPLAKELAGTLEAPDASSHIGLLTLHKISPATYYALDPDFRYRVLMDALSKAQVMNAWGVPHAFLTQPAARAIICEGPAIERYLYPVLDVDTKTEVFGAAEQERYKEEDPNVYRVKDYALALIFAIRGGSFEMPATREERDGYIQTIKKEATARARSAPPRGAEGSGPKMPECPPRGDATQAPTQNEPPPAQAAQTARK